MRIVAEFQASIRNAVPDIVTLLEDINVDASMAGACSLAKLSEKGKASNALN